MHDLIDLTAFIQRDGAELMTDSRAVSVAFGKRHKSVLRIIDQMGKSAHPEIAEHRRLNFAPTMYSVPGPKGAIRREPMYRMTADGLVAELDRSSDSRNDGLPRREGSAFNARTPPMMSRSWTPSRPAGTSGTNGLKAQPAEATSTAGPRTPR